MTEKVSGVQSCGIISVLRAMVMVVSSVMDAALTTRARVRDRAPAAMLNIVRLGNHAEATVERELVSRTRGQSGPRAYHLHSKAGTCAHICTTGCRDHETESAHAH